jgi:hypothetical protein
MRRSGQAGQKKGVYFFGDDRKKELGVARQTQYPRLRLWEWLLLDLETVAGLRDRAMQQLGFTGAFRRSELTALGIQGLRFREDCLAGHDPPHPGTIHAMHTAS